MLAAIARTLRPGGHLAFDTRQPVLQAWLDWATQSAPVAADIPGIGMVQRHLAVTAVRPPFISLRHTYRFASDGAVVATNSTFRFRSRSEVKSDLAARGYRLVDVRDAPDRPAREFIFIAHSRSRRRRSGHGASTPQEMLTAVTSDRQ